MRYNSRSSLFIANTSYIGNALFPVEAVDKQLYWSQLDLCTINIKVFHIPYKVTEHMKLLHSYGVPYRKCEFEHKPNLLTIYKCVAPIKNWGTTIIVHVESCVPRYESML